MKKWIIPLLALLCAGICIILSLGAVRDARQEKAHCLKQIAALEEENRQLKQEVAQLTAQLDEEAEAEALTGGLRSWLLDVSPWDNGTGADITLTAQVEHWHENLHAQLMVEQEGQEIANNACQWENGAFTTTVPLSAADGYGYYLILTLPDGTQQSYTLTTPNNPVQDIPVYLASSLSAYCTLVVENWEVTPEGMQLGGIYSHVQLPRLSPAGGLSAGSARLELYHNDTLVHTQPVDLALGETPDSLQLILESLLLPLPEMAQDDILELQLAVDLSNGTQITAPGISWFGTSEGLDAIVG